MKCEVRGNYSFSKQIPNSYKLYVGIIEDPRLSMIAQVLVQGGQTVIPEKFFEVIPELHHYFSVEDYSESFELFDIQARNFLKATAEEYSYSWKNDFNLYLKQTRNVYSALNMLGATIKEQMQLVIQYHNWIKDGYIMTEFKERTGGDPRPLINTGHMLHSIDYKVVTL